MTASTPTPCPACGTPAAGRYCSQCGASLVARACDGCGAPLSPQARFCHRCGRPAEAGGAGAAGGAPARRSERSAWIFAGAMCVLLVGTIAYKVLDERPAPVVPSMANPGSAAAPGAAPGPPAPSAPAPDISRMTPRERFDRLFNRVMQAAEQFDTAEVVRFTPMALGAYAQLDSVDADARYHAAVLLLQTGEAGAAAAVADTLLAESPGHLFGHMVRGEAAKLRGDEATLARARREFLASFPAETAARRPEYADHAPAVEAFKREAEGP